MQKILSIAGSDSSSIAGIQADVRTAQNHNTYCATCITALTAQNSYLISEIQESKADFFEKQLDILLSDIKFDAIKIGMIPNAEIANIIFYKLRKSNIKIIFDPVISSSSNIRLANNEAIKLFICKIIKLCYLITPNIIECEHLCNIKIKTYNDIKNAAIILREMGANNILIKGGHLDLYQNKINNLLYLSNNFHIISNKKLIKDFRGTGCTLSTAITCNVAKGTDLLTSVRKANRYLYCLAKKSLKVGSGSKILL